MSDPLNTTRFDGAPCYICGDDAAHELRIVEGRRIEDRALCGPCANDMTAICPDCSDHIWVKDGERVYVSADLYCADCAAIRLGAERMRVLQRDEDRDDFNEARR